MRLRKGKRPTYSDAQLRDANPPPGFDTDGWHCSDCGEPCYAFGHLHPDGWRNAVPPRRGR
jgi:hypothetical protein